MHEFRSIMQNGGSRDIVVRKGAGRGVARPPAGLTGIAVKREESRKTNQRREERHINLADKAVITFRRKKIDVEVVNISSHGVMIEGDFEPRVGERLQIAIENCDPTRCAVRWVKGRQIGLEFAEETVLIAPSNVRQLIVSGRRAGEEGGKLEMKPARPPRHAMIIKGVLHCGIESYEVRLRNISENGAMVDCSEDLVEDAPVVLELAGGGAVAVQARVCWSRSGQIGLLFETPFDMRLLADGTPVKPPSTGVMHYLKPDYLGSDGQPDSPWAARTYGLRPDDL